MRQTDELNKREMFDAMRACHQSEISHNQDAISVPTSLLAATGAAFAALILPKEPVAFASVLAFIVALAVTALAMAVVFTTNRKNCEEPSDVC